VPSSSARGQVVAVLAHRSGKPTQRSFVEVRKRIAPPSFLRTSSDVPRPEFSAMRPVADTPPSNV
jgi:hypothetical protein